MHTFENDTEPTRDMRHPVRPLLPAMLNGARQKCPKCGKGQLFQSYLKVHDSCEVCGEELHHHRADDAPAYFTIAIVGKIIVGFFVWLELAYEPPFWVHAALWTPLIFLMALSFLTVIKGAVIGLQWANYMHGFDPNFEEGDDIEKPHDANLSKPGVM
ncbi:MAG: DUF983 domain-containing protein [Pseudomonadota bacterium]